MRKIKEIDVDGRTSTFVVEDYKNEAKELFLNADLEADDEVIILYDIDSCTGENIELYREDWL